MTADPHRSLPTALAATTAVVVQLGRSTGSAAVAAGLALAHARSLDHRQWALLAELDPRGGDLLEKLVLGGNPRSDTERDVPAGARELAEHLLSEEFDRTLAPQANPARPVLGRYLVELAGVPNLRLLLGDPLVDGAARAEALIAPRLAALARSAGASTTIIDAGPWTSGEPDRFARADIVYAVVQATSASQNSRCLAELSSLWRILQRANPPARLVGVVTDPAWPVADLCRLFEQPSTAGPGPRGYRVVILTGRRHHRLLTLLGTGAWRSITAKALDPFYELASPLSDPLAPRPALPAGPPASAAALPAGSGPGAELSEHAYIARAVTGPSAGDQPGLSPTTGWSPAVAAPFPLELEPDPNVWPFAHDGDGPPDPALSPAMEAALGLQSMQRSRPVAAPPRRLRRHNNGEADQ